MNTVAAPAPGRVASLAAADRGRARAGVYCRSDMEYTQRPSTVPM